MKLSGTPEAEIISLLEEAQQIKTDPPLTGAELAQHHKNYLIVVLTLGAAVLISYIVGALAIWDNASKLWGTISGSFRYVYSISMFAAAVGYIYSNYWYLNLNQVAYRPSGRLSFIKPQNYMLWSTIAFLATSIFWIPLADWAIVDVRFDF